MGTLAGFIGRERLRLLSDRSFCLEPRHYSDRSLTRIAAVIELGCDSSRSKTPGVGRRAASGARNSVYIRLRYPCNWDPSAENFVLL